MGEKLNAGDICNRIATVAERDMTLAQAAQLMREITSAAWCWWTLPAPADWW